MLIRALLKTGAAAAWSFKPLFDLMVLLLTVYKSAKFKRVPRPALIDVLIADGMSLSVARLFGAVTDLVMQGCYTSRKDVPQTRDIDQRNSPLGIADRSYSTA